MPLPLHVGRNVPALHLVDEPGAVVFMGDLEDIGVDCTASVKRIVERGRHEVANGLFNGLGNRLPLRSCDRIRVEGVEHEHTVVGGDDAAVEESALVVGRVNVVARNDLL
jgi:hypothetical protein